VNVNVILRESSTPSYSIGLELRQGVYLERDPKISPGAYAATWSTGSAGHGSIDHIRARVKDKADEFSNAWLSVNPKK